MAQRRGSVNTPLRTGPYDNSNLRWAGMTSDEIYRTQQFGKRTGFGKRPCVAGCRLRQRLRRSASVGRGQHTGRDRGRGSTVGFFFASGSFRSFSPASFTPRTAPTPDLVREGASLTAPHGKRRRESSRERAVAASRRVRGPQNSGVSLFRNASRERLTGRATDTLVVTGCTTSGCVRASVVDAMSMNFRTVVASDAVGDTAHRAT